MGDRRGKDALFDGFAEVAKALASGRRAEIVDVLSQGERSVESIAEELGQSLANTSHHLRALARAGLVRTRRDGTRIFYALSSERVAALWAALRDVAADHVAGIERLATAYLGDRTGLEAISRQELVARLALGDVVVLDVRPDVEYRAGHIPGARSVPPAELRRSLAVLPEGTEVVAYCRGPYCVDDRWADAVISNGVINLCADKWAVFAEIFRVLRPGGVLQFADIANGRPVPPEALRDIDLWTG